MWKSVLGSDGVYEVSDCGLVRRLGKWGGEIVSRVEKHTGYVVVSLRIGGVRKPYYVHRLVAQAFIPNPDDLPFVNHKDEDKHNNCADNLEWCTRSYNRNYGTCTERQRAKMLGRVVSEETREKLRIAGLGRKHSEATKRKISEAVRRRNDGKMGECLSPENL